MYWDVSIQGYGLKDLCELLCRLNLTLLKLNSIECLKCKKEKKDYMSNGSFEKEP